MQRMVQVKLNSFKIIFVHNAFILTFFLKLYLFIIKERKETKNFKKVNKNLKNTFLIYYNRILMSNLFVNICVNIKFTIISFLST